MQDDLELLELVAQELNVQTINCSFDTEKGTGEVIYYKNDGFTKERRGEVWCRFKDKEFKLCLAS